ncbi:hypothetical protein O181_035499 [Austropuccinia psidii MF-1]|uniref:Uncharacterized protein n=1 Tax=Austropuccinia psidii MF-1 TaxID=1389203 RepID=A0A9Q3D2S0_9BASI|nr:hypothetical protein [Austropuccinia psidii MF-1]
MKEFFNACQKINPQSQGHFFGNIPHHQEAIKPDSQMEGNPGSPSNYQDGYNMTYFKKEALKNLSEATSLLEFSGVGEYAHMDLIDYIYGLFIDGPSIPDYWITARLNNSLKGNSGIWYSEMK